MEKRQLAGTDDSADGTFDLTPLETQQFAEAIAAAEPGWTVVTIRPTGINLEGPFDLSKACTRQAATRGYAYLFNIPPDGHVLKTLLQGKAKDNDEITFSFDVEDGEIREGNFSLNGGEQILAIIHPGTWKWRAG